jgi:hypothetical protein
MQRKAQSRELKERLRFDSGSVRLGSAFVEQVRSALRKMDRGGSKRHRVLYGDENSASATERLIIELAACGNPRAAIERLRDAYCRAFDDLIARLYGPRALRLEQLICEETVINGQQNIDAVEVLTDGSLSDLERLRESTQQQLNADQLLLAAIDERIAQTRGAA